jgi:hypothetical protein
MALHSEWTMQRRQFLAASVAASTVGIAGKLAAESAPTPSRDYYQLRRYNLLSGPQLKLTESYFSDALIPALGRLGMGPVGALKLDIGPETPSYFLVIPSTNLADLAELDLRLTRDAEFLHAAQPFWNATNAAPAFIRLESWLLKSFEGWPKLTPPTSAATKGKRIFQLRTYESPSDGDHVRKVEMFHSGEFDIFAQGRLSSRLLRRYADRFHACPISPICSASPTGRARILLGRVPRCDPAWKKLSSDPRLRLLTRSSPTSPTSS